MHTTSKLIQQELAIFLSKSKDKETFKLYLKYLKYLWKAN